LLAQRTEPLVKAKRKRIGKASTPPTHRLRQCALVPWRKLCLRGRVAQDRHDDAEMSQWNVMPSSNGSSLSRPHRIF